MKKEKINIEDELFTGLVVVLLGGMTSCFYFTENVGEGFLMCFAFLFLYGFSYLIVMLLFKTDEGYCIEEKTDCDGKKSYKPYCYHSVGRFIVDTEPLWDTYYTSKVQALLKIETTKQNLEKEKCETTYKTEYIE